jgi:hypothetical protein
MSGVNPQGRQVFSFRHPKRAASYPQGLGKIERFDAVVDRMLLRLICPGFGLGGDLQGIGYGPAIENSN